MTRENGTIPLPYGVSVERRRVLAGLSLGVAAFVAGCEPARTGSSARRVVPPSTRPPSPPSSSAPIPDPPTPATASRRSLFAAPDVPPDPIDPATMGVLRHATFDTRNIALTVDDGFDADTVAAYVTFAHDTGIHLTLCPNGIYSRTWEPHAEQLRPLIEAGQIQIGNHTFAHKDLTTLPSGRIRAEVERNEEWITSTFGTTSVPYLRPPYGTFSAAVAATCAEVGFTKLVLWNGSFGDAAVLTADVLLEQAQKYLQRGTVMLGHANHPTVTHLYDRIVELIQARALSPVTLDEMFGTRRVAVAKI